MRLFATSLFLFCLASLSPAATIDPTGDTYGTGLQFDMISTSGVTKGQFTTFEIRFAQPVPADLDQFLWGAIEVDVDRNPATGKNSEINYPNQHFPHGVDYVIGFYYDDPLGKAAILDVTNDKYFYLDAEYGADYVRVTVPIFGSHPDGKMLYAAGVGDGQDMNSLYSDITGVDYQLLETETAAVPEPGTWALCGGALGLIGAMRRSRRN